MHACMLFGMQLGAKDSRGGHTVGDASGFSCVWPWTSAAPPIGPQTNPQSASALLKSFASYHRDIHDLPPAGVSAAFSPATVKRSSNCLFDLNSQLRSRGLSFPLGPLCPYDGRAQSNITITNEAYGICLRSQDTSDRSARSAVRQLCKLSPQSLSHLPLGSLSLLNTSHSGRFRSKCSPAMR